MTVEDSNYRPLYTSLLSTEGAASSVYGFPTPQSLAVDKPYT
ncbi:MULTISPECIES: hypothetical protein [unclassified Leptolyngbya]|nr:MULTISPECIES: hypothetical protein [unclassified Leptolyngbya]